MTDDQLVALIAAVLYAGELIDRRVSCVEDAINKDPSGNSWAVTVDENIATARNFLAAARSQS